MARLPVPGSDEGVWGDVLNDFLSQEHNSDGTQKALPQSKITNLTSDLAAKAPVNNPTFTGTVTLPGNPSSNLHAATKQYVDTNAPATPDADASTKGKLQLAGDLGGTAASPTVPSLSSKAPINSPTFTGSVTLPGNPSSNLQAATKQYVDTTASAGTPDADATTKGKLQLAGDLGGTAASPTVPGLSGKASTSTTVTGGTSLTGGGDLSANRTLTLVNDSSSPGNSKYYGTNGSGTKGYYDLPAGGGGAVVVTSSDPSATNYAAGTTIYQQDSNGNVTGVWVVPS